MKKYIFFTNAIHWIGGGQMYVAGKARYLEQNGWTVYMFHNDAGYGESEIPSLTKYICNSGFPELIRPPYKCSDQRRNEILNRMVDLLRIDPSLKNEIIIETYTSFHALWGELLAERIHGRHFFLTCEEDYREGFHQFYFENLDFYAFKYHRNEILGDNDRLKKLMNGYGEDFKSIIPNGVHFCAEQDAIQDVENHDIELKLGGGGADFSVAYISRTEKPYFPAVCRGVVEFAQKYPDKKIRFIIVGRFVFTRVLDSMNRIFAGIQNVEIISLGNLVPIPRKIFQYIDVVCAGSGAAWFCAYENTPVITANAESDRTPGLIFYDTQDSLYGNPIMTYAEALEKVLINHEYDNRKIDLPDKKPADWHYKIVLEIQRKNSTPLEYFTAKLNKDLRRNWIAQFPFHKMQQNARIVLYGAGDVSLDYQKQIGDGKFCKIVAIVADDHENYDRTILPPEKLTELEYDGIVIAEIPDQQRINEITSKVFQITGKRNFVYDWKIVQVI